jgi:signal peptidase I
VATTVTVVHDHLGFAPVLSPSMEPAFRPGDLVITRPEPAADIAVGQVLALPVPGAPGQRYVHRIISVSESDGYPVIRTKGDANATPEPFALRITSPTVPLVVATIPELGRVSVLVHHEWVRVVVLALTIAAIALAGWRLAAGTRRPRAIPAEAAENRHG